MRNEWVVLLAASLAASGAVVLACGSESSSGADLLSDPSAEAGSSGDSSDNGTSGGPTSSSGGPRPADDSGVTADGGIDPPDAGPGGDTSTITCGATTCLIPAETCCVSEVRNGGDRAFACVAAATCPRPPGGGDTAALKCSGAANCPSGTVCCVREQNGNAASECKSACDRNEAQLCDPKAGDASGCPSSDPCSSDNIGDWGRLPRTYGTCGGQEP